MTELLYYIVMGVLIATCFVSLIVIAIKSNGKGAKIFFSVLSAVCIVGGLFLTLVWCGVLQFKILAPVIRLKSIVAAPILNFALTVIAASEFACMLYRLTHKEKRIVVTAKTKETAAQSPVEYSLPDNERAKGERKHGDYKIVETEE